MCRARRILCYGVTGSGKTTFATALGEARGIAHTEVDRLCWLPGWVTVPEEEQRAKLAQVVERETFLLDSAYGAWLDLVLPRTELVIGLDYSRALTLGRLVRRTVARNLDHREICNGNVERWSNTVSRDSILLWHLKSFARKRERMRAWEADPDGPRILRLTHPRQAAALLDELTAPSPGDSGEH